VIENIELYKDDKIKLKHLSIDKNTPLNEWMVKGALFVLNLDPEIEITPIDEYTTYTMDIPNDLKQEIRSYTEKKEIKIRDFWVKVSHIILEKEGDFDA
jgi:hypothetical protein